MRSRMHDVRRGVYFAGLWFGLRMMRHSRNSIHQMALKDDADPKETYLYKLSQQTGAQLLWNIKWTGTHYSIVRCTRYLVYVTVFPTGFGYFRYVLLVSARQDTRVPFHSARIELFPRVLNDRSERGIDFVKYNTSQFIYVPRSVNGK